MNNIEKLLYLHGVASDYRSYHGEHISIPHDDRLQVLAAMGCDVVSDEAINRKLFELDAKPWTSWLSPLHIVHQADGSSVDIRVAPDDQDQLFSCVITLESGREIKSQLTPAELPEVGNYHIGDVRYSARRMTVSNLPLGYHQLTLSSGGESQSTTLIVSPGESYKPAGISEGHKPWGISCQLYTLRSDSNWGIGDFGDLLTLIECSAPLGVNMIGLNPLHAPLLSGTDFASPYSPSDRRFLNPLYIDIERSLDFIDNPAAVALVQSRTYQFKLKNLRDTELVDYNGVRTVKWAMFETMFTHFEREHLRRQTPRALQFLAYAEHGGHRLQAFADFEAAQYPKLAPANNAQFHQYLQWQANAQLQRCQAAALNAGMTVGLVGDLAIGAIRDGAEVASNRALFNREASIGAPPDPLAAQGQNWNLPAVNPIELRAQGYQHFVSLLRSNMACYGALRIDHVLGLLRLWWCLPGLRDGGAYVYYPLDDMLAIVRLESHRNRCVVIGEDMGVVPDELRQRLSSSGVYGNKLLYFETDADGRFKSPLSHQSDALLMVSNHDVPTLAGWWLGTDISLLEEIGQLTADEAATALQQRANAKHAMLRMLDEEELLPQEWAHSLEQDTADAACKRYDQPLCKAILQASARTRCTLLLVQLDDLNFIQHPVNIPGTDREYPNWRRKLAIDNQRLFQRQEIRELLTAINRERSK